MHVLPEGIGRGINTAAHTVAEMRQDRVMTAMFVELRDNCLMQVELLHLPVERGAADAKGERRLRDVAAGARQRPQQGCLFRFDDLFLLRDARFLEGIGGRDTGGNPLVVQLQRDAGGAGCATPV